MPSATLGAIREAIASILNTQLGPSTGLTAFPRWPDTYPSFPIAIVMPDSMEYHRLMGDQGGLLTLEVLVITSIGSGGYERAQEKLDELLDFMSGYGVHDAVEPFNTLNGIVDSVIVSGFDQYGAISLNDIDYLGARVKVEVTT